MTIPHGHGYRPFRQRFELIVPRSHDGAERRGTHLIGRRVGADHGPRCQAPARDSVDGVDATSQPQLSGLSHLRRRSGGEVMNVSANIPAACRIDISMSPSSPNGASLLSLRATTREGWAADCGVASDERRIERRQGIYGVVQKDRPYLFARRE